VEEEKLAGNQDAEAVPDSKEAKAKKQHSFHMELDLVPAVQDEAS